MKFWEGRFLKFIVEIFDFFNVFIMIDIKFFEYDIFGFVVYVKMFVKCNIIFEDEVKFIIDSFY